MKTTLRCLVLALTFAGTSGAHLRRTPVTEQHLLSVSVPKTNSSLLQGAQNLEADAALMIADLLAGKGTSLREAVKNVHDKLKIEDAIQRLQGKLPDDVSSLLRLGGKQAKGDFSEESLAKARVILNGMVEKSFAELDDVIIDCKAFENMNRVTFGQVRTDIARLGSEIAEADEKGTENYNCVEDQDAAYKAVAGTLETEKSSYLKIKAENDAEMTIKKNDLAVFNFIMEITKCEASGAAFFQMGANNSSPVKVCSTKEGFELDFTDPKIQAKMSKLITPGARTAIREALGLALAGKKPALLQRGAANQSASTTGAATTPPPQMTVTLEPVPVKEEPPASTQWKKCTDGPVNCGLLHDTMSLQWGKFKDLVDELQSEMDKNDDEWETLKGNLNEQMKVITGIKGECQTQFDAAVGTKNTLTEESNEKNEQERELDAHYEKYMAVCKARIEELLFTDVCAVRKVRNEVMKSSTVTPPDKITDCDVKDWVAAPCTVPCDDTCPHLVGGQVDPYSCGGKQALTRSIIVNANEFGIKCPALSAVSRCSQFKCSVDCSLSEWSGWSKCTKECEGGAQQMTRSVMTKPKHGGKACDATVETRACHTMSCDRNCKLDGWTTWSPCSMACNPGGMPGFQERVRKVLIPTRGEGTCPMTDNADRYEKQTCNEQPCLGDEICIAKQDLIIALDASGSLRETGFEILRDFAANLTGSYKPMYYGEATVQIGAILFGNGVINDDNTIAPAEHVVGLTGDLSLVKEKLEATTWQKGFTNMAQAFVLADTMFQQGGRDYAQSAVLVLSDGKYSFAFETEQAVNKLKEKGTMVFFAPVADVEGDWQHKLKEWSSQPWETNYELLPGLQAVKHNMNTFTSALVAKFCSDAVSPSAEAAKDDQVGFMLIHEGGFPSDDCGHWVDIGLVDTQEECAEKSETQAEYQAFSVTAPQQWYNGKRHCYAEAIPVSAEMWKVWQGDKTSIPCESGSWLDNPMYDVYAIEPVVV